MVTFSTSAATGTANLTGRIVSFLGLRGRGRAPIMEDMYGTSGSLKKSKCRRLAQQRFRQKYRRWFNKKANKQRMLGYTRPAICDLVPTYRGKMKVIYTLRHYGDNHRGWEGGDKFKASSIEHEMPSLRFWAKTIDVNCAQSGSNTKPVLRSAHFGLNIGSPGMMTKMRRACAKLGKVFRRITGGRPTGGYKKRATWKPPTPTPPSHFELVWECQ